MRTLLVSGLVAIGLIGTGAAGVTLVAAPVAPPSHVELPEQARVADDEEPVEEEPVEEEPIEEEPVEEEPIEEEPEEPAEEEPEEPGTPASEEGAQKRADAWAFVGSMQEWTACVAEAAPAHDPASGDFDPETACGDKPVPPAANEADDTGRPGETPPADAGAEGRETAEQAQQGGRPGGGEDTEDEGDQGAGRPDGAGPPAGTGRP